MPDMTSPMPQLYSITLTPEEYQAIVTNIASRDPVLRLLMSKQEAATQAAQNPYPSPHDYAFGKRVPEPT